jgi:ABC-type transport system involved in cytochrome bd biosynthesis fused ATPase/permease subunit
MIRFISNTESNQWHGMIIVFGFFITTFLKNIFDHLSMERGVSIGIRLRTCLTNLIFSKSFKLSSKSKRKRNSGEIVNLMSQDVESFFFSDYILIFIWLSPLQFFLSIYLLYLELGM